MSSKPQTAMSGRLAELIEKYGLKPGQSKSSYIFDCPRCKKRNLLYLFKDTGRFQCHKCVSDGFCGKPEFALSEILLVPVSEIRKFLYSTEVPTAEAFFSFDLINPYSDDEIVESAPDISSIPTAVWPVDALPISDPRAKKGASYLESRGIPLDVAIKYGIRYSGTQTRVLFPVQHQGRLFGWQGRFVGVTEFVNHVTGKTFRIPKALTSEGLRKDKIVMFADNITNSEHIIICEGPVDAIKFDLCGGAIATLGKSVSEAQMNLIRFSGASKVYLALDPDAYKETERLIRELYPYVKLYQIDVPKGRSDFGECSFEEAKDAFLRAEPTSLTRLQIYLKPPPSLMRRT